MIAIVGTFVGLLLPAVQQAREAARRLQCQNNLKQIGLALHNYHDALKRLPSGYISGVDATGNDKGPGWCWSSLLLPQLEQTNLHRQINFNVGLEHPSNSAIRLIKLTSFLCPPDTTPDHWQAAKRDLATGSFQSNICDVAPANYVGVFGTFEPGVDGDGIFFRNSAIGLQDISDGSSSTLMVGERSFRLGEATWSAAVTGAVIVPDGSDGVGTGAAIPGNTLGPLVGRSLFLCRDRCACRNQHPGQCGAGDCYPARHALHNVISCVFLACLLIEAFRRKSRSLGCICASLALVDGALVVSHAQLTGMMNFSEHTVPGEFYSQHGIYLWITAIQWALGMVVPIWLLPSVCIPMQRARPKHSL